MLLLKLEIEVLKNCFMGELIGETLVLLSEFALNIQEYFFRRKRAKRREYEREHNLPRKKMISPSERVIILFLGFLLIVGAIGLFAQLFNNNEKKTKEKIKKIRTMLEKEKEVLGGYPEQLEAIKRNNPLYNTLHLDGWGNKFKYQTKNGEYSLISVGPDGKLGTKDDIQ